MFIEGGVVPSKGSRFSTFSHCHAVQEMYDKTLLTIPIKREMFGWRDSNLCVRGLHFVCKRVVVILFTALKCLVVFDHILKNTVQCAQAHSATERYDHQSQRQSRVVV